MNLRGTGRSSGGPGDKKAITGCHDSPGAPFRLAEILFLPGGFQLPPKALRSGATPGHARPAKPIQDHIAGLRVVQDRWDDRQVGDFGVVGVSLINRIRLAFADIHGDRDFLTRKPFLQPPTRFKVRFTYERSSVSLMVTLSARILKGHD